MTPMFLRVGGVVAALTLSLTAFAQIPAQQPAQPQPGTQTTAAAPKAGPAQAVTATGCVQAEADFRKTRNLGRGGAGGTGVGVGNEFVLIDAKIASAGTTRPPSAATSAPAAPAVYKLTAGNEGKVSPFVGKRVEITGTLGPEEITGPTRRPTGTPRIDVFAGEDLKLRELAVSSVRETAGTCPAK